MIQELERVGGIAFVAFKNPESPTAFSSGGLRLGMTSTVVARALDAISAAGGEILDFYPAVGAARMRLTLTAAAALRRSAFVDFVEPLGQGTAEVPGALGAIAPSRVAAAPRGPMAQITPWGITMIGGPTVWGEATGAGVRVMIMDYGVKSHRDLPSVPLNHCGGLIGACDPPEQYGTFEAGGFFALNNALDVVGTAPGVTSANIFTWRWLYDIGATTHCDRSMEYDGFQAALDSGVKVIAIPVSIKEYDAGEASWIATLWSNNIVVVAPLPIVQGPPIATDSSHPAQLLNVVGVAGVKTDTSFADNSACGAYSSKYGPMVDVVAPFWGTTTGNNNDLWTYCGNSHGVTHVAGVLALMRQKFPTYTASALVQKLFQSAIDRGPGGWDDHYGHGLVNAPGALYVAPPPFTMSIDGPRYVRAYSTCTWIAAASGGQPPYTYQWYLDGSPAGTEQSFTYTAGTTFFRLQVWVNDAASGSGSSRLTVDIDPNAEQCFI